VFVKETVEGYRSSPRPIGSPVRSLLPALNGQEAPPVLAPSSSVDPSPDPVAGFP